MPDPSELPPTPAAAHEVFGDRLGLAERYVALLADTGTTHGLIGPRETPRLWSRHVLNSAVVEAAIPHTGSVASPTQVVDVGSGAGLPGIPLAIARPDLHVHLVEPLARRTAWLQTAVDELGLTNATVHTARAEALWGALRAPVVTARAVSTLVQLAEWTLPLLSDGGSILALKGSRGVAELEDGGTRLRRLGVVDSGVEILGEGTVEEPTLVVRLTIGSAVEPATFRRRPTSSAGSARRRADRPRGSRRGGTPPSNGGSSPT